MASSTGAAEGRPRGRAVGGRGESGGNRPPNGETRTANMSAAWKRRMELGDAHGTRCDGDGRIDREEGQGMEPSDGLARKGKGIGGWRWGRDKRRKWIQSSSGSMSPSRLRLPAGAVTRTPWYCVAVMYSAESDMTAGWDQKRKCVVRGAKGKVVSRRLRHRIVVGPSASAISAKTGCRNKAAQAVCPLLGPTRGSVCRGQVGDGDLN